jgi:NitT/TauT family transport system substrate-binding protein
MQSRKMKYMIMHTCVSVIAATLLLGNAMAEEGRLTRVKFGTLGASTSNVYQYLGLEKGIYRKYGVDLDIAEFLHGGPELVAAAASNQINLGSVGTPVLAAISRGLPIRIVGSPPRRGQTFVLVGRLDVKSVAELKGKQVGISSVGGGTSQALEIILKANGLREDDVKTIAFGTGPNGYLSLKSGQLSAAILNEPYVTKAELDGIGKTLVEAHALYGRYQHSYVFATQKYIKDEPEAIRAYFRADREALQYAIAHQDELFAIGKKRLGLDDAVLKATLAKELARWEDVQTVDIQGLLNAIIKVQEAGDISKSYKPVIEQIVEPGFVK